MKRAAPYLATITIAVAVAFVLWPSASEPPPDRAIEAHPERSHHQRSPSAPQDARVERNGTIDAPLPGDTPAPPPSTYPSMTEWMAVAPLALASQGFEAVNPWQGEEAAADMLCSGTDAVRYDDLDAWAEAGLWNREARIVWWVSRRFTGQDRIDAVRSFVDRAGVTHCPTLDAMEQALNEGRESSVVAPSYGDAKIITRRDRRVLDRLRAGLQAQE